MIHAAHSVPVASHWSGYQTGDIGVCSTRRISRPTTSHATTAVAKATT